MATMTKAERTELGQHPGKPWPDDEAAKFNARTEADDEAEQAAGEDALSGAVH